MIGLFTHDRAEWGLLARWQVIVEALRIAKRPPAVRRRQWLAAMRADGPWHTPVGDQGNIRRATLLLYQALMAYRRSGRLAAPITLLKGAQAPSGGIFGWEAFGQVTCVSVPGDHKSLIEAPHVQVLAARLGEALREPPAPV
jgi:thioesterase domain-containing protein